MRMTVQAEKDRESDREHTDQEIESTNVLNNKQQHFAIIITSLFFSCP